ncbi:hypothetical protein ETAE_1609 [Edwardsiella piscicida]|uniref:Uncharacterized protein n=2 Tax=Edwardsiella piscicida TaxID=1263550 RepID=A0AAQ3C743_EDWPI|nr:hypothetical protein [Edwardsiella piscicida]ACY84450.1 hypothetical protein ETAE_1609 [Edwardsiella tarda EIB202]MDM3866409.1 hypothetical protein [Edwardsiella piscicida]QHR94093.1 hypothetical protein GT752_01605 [Edwardsiella piscicida]UJT83975.1 hypothetical protein L1P07_07870 [Edwardsiella piscicida]UJT87246.1 hypothetical protein L1P05_07870 [Edwardsiella piscicida]
MSIEALQNAVAILLQNPDRPFAVGDVVLKKEGIGSITKRPHIGEKVVVSHVFATPVVNLQERSGSLYYSMIYDIRVAFLDSDGDLVELAEDSRRFRHADD